MADMTAAIKTYRLEREAWEEAYFELQQKSEDFAGEQRRLLTDLRGQIDEERAAWKTGLRKAKGPGFGLFAGIGYTGSGYEAVIGVGVVWRLF
jgi:hypothetical protein